MKTLLGMLSVVLLVVLFPAGAFAWSPSEGFQQWSQHGYTIQYPELWVNHDPSPLLLKASDTSGYPCLVADVSTRGKYSSFLDVARKMGATDLKVLSSIGFVTLPSGLKVKEGKINFVYQNSTYFAAVLTYNGVNPYFSCMVVFPWKTYNQAFAQDIFNTLYKKTTANKK